MTGLLVGLGFLCKYTNALELISILIVLGLTRKLRARISSDRTFISLLCGFPGLHDSGESFGIRSTPGSPSPISGRAAASIAHQDFIRSSCSHFWANISVTYSPLLFLGLAWATIASWRRAQQNFKVLYPSLARAARVSALRPAFDQQGRARQTGMDSPISASRSSRSRIGVNARPRARKHATGRTRPSFSA